MPWSSVFKSWCQAVIVNNDDLLVNLRFRSRVFNLEFLSVFCSVCIFVTSARVKRPHKMSKVTFNLSNPLIFHVHPISQRSFKISCDLFTLALKPKAQNTAKSWCKAHVSHPRHKLQVYWFIWLMCALGWTEVIFFGTSQSLLSRDLVKMFSPSATQCSW